MREPKRFDDLVETLMRFNVPADKLEALRASIAHLEALEGIFAGVGMPDSATRKQLIMLQQFVISSSAIFLLKKYTGKKVLVIMGTARAPMGSRQYRRIVRLARLAGPDWIIVHGGGGGSMDAARVGGRLGGSIIVALNFDSEFVINGQSGVKDDVNLYHAEFYSRVFAFLEYADAIIIDMGGLGTLQEKAWAEGCIQCGVHNAVPMFVLSKTFWKHLTKHTHDVLIKHKFISEDDRGLIRLVEIGKEAGIYDRIRAYYDARPELVLKQARALGNVA